jgi:hypothetical protein
MLPSVIGGPWGAWASSIDAVAPLSAARFFWWLSRIQRKLQASSISGRQRLETRGEMEVAMKASLMVLVVLLLVAGGALGVMNNACKTGHHVWCKTHVSGMPHTKGGSS